jgi:3-phosphoshikimate 1-carboxyvinyltransferase
MVSFHPFRPRGTVRAPASKSYAQRAIACSVISNHDVLIEEYDACDDSEYALKAAHKLGCTIEYVETSSRNLRVGHRSYAEASPKGRPIILNFGGSATSFRIFTGISCVTPGVKLLRGTAQLMRRPMKELIQALNSQGARITSKDGSPPLTVYPTGLMGGTTMLSGRVSSQYTSSLMIAGTRANSPVEIVHSQVPASAGYIRITAHVLGAFGAKIEHESDCRRVVVNPTPLSATRFKLEGDYSSASYILAMGAIRGEIKVTNLPRVTYQPDAHFLEILKVANASLKIDTNSVTVWESDLEGFEADLEENPDLCPLLAVLGAYAKGQTVLTGLDRLKYKETDRVVTTLELLKSLGVSCSYDGSAIRITGGSVLGGIVNSYGDHRIALAAAAASVGSCGRIEVTGFGCHTKSYPDFLRHYRALEGSV